MRRLLLVLSALALAAGCSNRERSNPLDPANPQTGGRPAGFNAVAGYGSVTLAWTAQPTLAIEGFQLFRLREGDSLYRPLGSLLPASASGFLDSGEPNGKLIRYRLYFITRGEALNQPSEDEATPGPLRPWVTEFGSAQLTRLSPDGRDVSFRVNGVGQVQGLAVSPTTGEAWCSARLDGFLSGCNTSGDIFVSRTGLSEPFDLAFSRIDGTLWMSDHSGALQHLGTDGFSRPPGIIGGMDLCEGVAVSPRDGSVWLCETGANRVRHFSANGTPIGATDLGSPSRVVVDSLSNVTWVTSYARGRVWRLGAAGNVIDSTSAASGPVGLVLDRAHGRAWIVDTLAGEVVALDPSTLAVLFRVGLLPGAWDVDVDRASGAAWVTVRGLGQVVRIGVNGGIEERCGGLSDPFEIRLDPGLE